METKGQKYIILVIFFTIFEALDPNDLLFIFFALFKALIRIVATFPFWFLQRLPYGIDFMSY
jgi:hypothetical protein